MNKREKNITLLLLHLLLLVYSTSGIFSKLASKEQFLSFRFCMYYSIVIFLLGVYAIGWQQIIKRLPLTTAFANKAITVLWGLIWGVLLFNESVTVGKLLGIALVISGIALFSFANERTENHE